LWCLEGCVSAVASDEIISRAKETGISERTLKITRQNIGVKSVKISDKWFTTLNALLHPQQFPASGQSCLVGAATGYFLQNCINTGTDCKENIKYKYKSIKVCKKSVAPIRLNFHLYYYRGFSTAQNMGNPFALKAYGDLQIETSPLVNVIKIARQPFIRSLQTFEKKHNI
jgi:hypothetical protein